jgi:hypothetical protein
MGGGGGRGSQLHLLPPVWQAGTEVQQVAAGSARRIVHLHCPTNVSFSFSTFLFLAASWTGVDKKYSHYLCRTLINFFLGGGGAYTARLS